MPQTGLQPTNASSSRYAMNCYSQSAANKTPTILTDLSEATSVPSMHRNFPVLLRRQLSAGESHRAERHGYPYKHKARWNRTRTIPLTQARKKAESIHRRCRHSHLEKARQRWLSWQRTQHREIEESKHAKGKSSAALSWRKGEGLSLAENMKSVPRS